MVTRHRQALVSAHARFVDWVIVGGESGPGARPMLLEWARDLVEQCKAAGVAVFTKQLGARPQDSYTAMGELERVTLKLADPKGGDIEEWPLDLRVRQFPAPRHAAKAGGSNE